MDMKQLFDDFKKHVESLDDDAIRQSIAKARESYKEGDECSKCDRCIHYVTNGVLNNDLFHVEYAYYCELNLINCDECFEEETDE